MLFILPLPREILLMVACESVCCMPYKHRCSPQLTVFHGVKMMGAHGGSDEIQGRLVRIETQLLVVESESVLRPALAL